VINKKGISPLIATVLLIGFTIVLAALVIRWGSELFSSQIKTQTCDNEATISCTSDVDIEITNAVFAEGATDTVTLNLISNGKQSIDNGWVVRVHKENGEVVAVQVAATGNELDPFGTKTISASGTLGSGTEDFDECTGKFCGVSVIPKIKHTTSKGDNCEVSCGQSEQRRPFDLGVS